MISHFAAVPRVSPDCVAVARWQLGKAAGGLQIGQAQPMLGYLADPGDRLRALYFDRHVEARDPASRLRSGTLRLVRGCCCGDSRWREDKASLLKV